MQIQPCPWTAGAIACQEHSERARGSAHDMRKVAASVDEVFVGTHAAAMNLAAAEDRMADSLVWMRDWAIFAAMHPVAVAAFRRAIEKGEQVPTFVRAPGRVVGATKPAGEPAVAALRVVKGGRP